MVKAAKVLIGMVIEKDVSQIQIKNRLLLINLTIVVEKSLTRLEWS